LRTSYVILLSIGISIPYLVQFYSTEYHKLIFSLITNIFAFELYSFSVFMAIVSTFALIYRLTKGPGAIQDSMIITTLTTPVVFPSLIMILLILAEFGEVPGRYFGSAVELYLAGIASLFIVLPILGIISHWYNLIKVRGSPISHILYTLVILSILNFIVISNPIESTSNEQLVEHGGNMIVNGIFVLQMLIANIIQSEIPIAPTNLGGGLQTSNWIIINTIYGISSALYIYFRLFRGHTIDKIDIDGPWTKTFFNIENLGKIGLTLILAILLNFVFILGFSTIFQSISTIIKASALALMSIFIVVIIANIFEWRKGI